MTETSTPAPRTVDVQVVSAVVEGRVYLTAAVEGQTGTRTWRATARGAQWAVEVAIPGLAGVFAEVTRVADAAAVTAAIQTFYAERTA